MENLQPHQILVPLAFAIFIGIMVLVWGDRPGLAEAVRGLFRSGDDDAPEPAEDCQPPPSARFEAKHFASYVAPVDVEPVRKSAEPLEPAAVLARLHQVEPGEPAEIEPAAEPSAPALNGHLSRAEIIALLAVQKNGQGDYAFSANKITDFVGGTAAEVKKQIAEIRDKSKPAEATAERGPRLRRPAEGW